MESVNHAGIPSATPTARESAPVTNQAGYASPAVAASIQVHVEWLDRQIEDVMAHVRRVIAADPVLTHNLKLLRGITGFGEISATILDRVPPRGVAALAAAAPSRAGCRYQAATADRLTEGSSLTGASVSRLM